MSLGYLALLPFFCCVLITLWFKIRDLKPIVVLSTLSTHEGVLKQFLTLLGLAILGIVQIVSVFCFIAWLSDMVRVKYLVACIIYGVLFLVVNFTLKNSVWQIIITALSLPMALFYFWYSWQFYKKYEERD